MHKDILTKLDQMQTNLATQYREICAQKKSMQVLKDNHEDLVKSFEKFQLRSDMLQQRSTEMFTDIKNEVMKMGGTFESYRAEQLRQMDVIKNQHNEDFNVKRARNWDNLLWYVGISFVGFLLGLLANKII